MKTVRCFLAVNLELKTAKNISKLQQKLISHVTSANPPFQSQFKWTPPQNMHQTVRFLGNITEPMIQAIKDSLEPVTQTSPPFTFETTGLKTFTPESPNILYAPIIDNTNELGNITKRVHEVLVNTGFKEVDKPFVPHITIARIEAGIVDEIQQLFALFGDINCGSSLVRDLVCYQSNLSKSGVDYQLLWTLPLLKRMQIKENTDTSDEKTADPTPNDAGEATSTQSAEESSVPNSADQGAPEQ